LSTVRISLVALFVTALMTSQVTASKILGFSSPVALPLTGDYLVVPGAALAYAVTYFATDCYSELYGRDAARQLVLVGFAMNFVVLALVFSTLAAPAAVFVEDPGVYDRVLGASANVVAGSLLAYIVSQNWDVWVFHRIREETDGEKLWLRNIGSTATSQAIDTVLFVRLPRRRHRQRRRPGHRGRYRPVSASLAGANDIVDPRLSSRARSYSMYPPATVSMPVPPLSNTVISSGSVRPAASPATTSPSSA